MNDDVWASSMRSALASHNTRLRQLRERLARAEQDLENAINKIEETGLQIDTEIEDSEKEQEKILSRRNNPIVYVRSYSKTTVDVYHGSLNCGWRGWTFERMLLGDAEDAGLRPCTSCGRLASPPTAA
jgi:hypothetical protein